MKFLPNWNSIESTARWGDALFWLGIGSLILLAVAEIASHIYSSRSAILQSHEMEKIIEGRVLSEEQIATLIKRLQLGLKPKKGVSLMGVQGNREANKLAGQLSKAFTAAGFTVAAVYEDSAIGGIGAGIQVRQNPLDHAVGVNIVSSLNGIGLATRLTEAAEWETDKIAIMIGYVP
jgi:hypothetical protein